jgi:hypothetical protein
VTTTADLAASVARFFVDRQIVLLGRPLTHYGRTVEVLRSMGARPPLVLANGLGEGKPPAGIAGHVLIDLGDGGFTATARAIDRFLRQPSAAARQALAEYDPQRAALVLVDSNVTSNRLDGRQIADGRPPQWAAVEDAPAVDALWRAIGVPRLPSELVPAGPTALAAAYDRLDLGSGVLCFGDAAAGPRLSWEQARLVRARADVAEAATALAECRWIRVLPYVSGVPAAINGIVLPDGVAVLPAVEELVLVGPQRTQLRYAGVSNCWDPDAALPAMRALARRVGDRLSQRYGFQGAFVVSGLARGSGFLPLDVLTRLAAPHQLMSRSTPELPWPLLHAAVTCRHDLGMSASAVEEILSCRVRAQPGAVVTLDTPRRLGSPATARWLTRDAAGLRLVQPGEPSSGCLVRDESAARATVSLFADPRMLPAGGSTAELASEAIALSDRLWGTELGPLVPLAR